MENNNEIQVNPSSSMSTFLIKISLFLLLFCGFQISYLSAQVFWDNDSGDGLWTTPANWIPDGVPLSYQIVNIGGSTTSVSIPAGTDVAIKQLLVAGGAKLIISPNSSLSISFPPLYGLRVNGAGSLVTNNGTLNAIYINEKPIKIEGNAVFINNGTINLDNSGIGGVGNGDGIAVGNLGTLTNTGHINIGPNITADGIQMQNGLITNSGVINILGAGISNLGDDGIEDSFGTNIIDNSGTICINDVTAGGGENIASGIAFTNTGTFTTSGCVATTATTEEIEVPTVGEWGLLILALLLMTCGTLYLIQRESSQIA